MYTRCKIPDYIYIHFLWQTSPCVNLLSSDEEDLPILNSFVKSEFGVTSDHIDIEAELPIPM